MDAFPPNIVNLLYSYGYYILFVLVVVEGPIVTVLSGILASIGFFNFFTTYLVVVVGDLTGDVFFYIAGRWWFRSLVNKKFKRLEESYKKHKGKILFFGKLSSFIGPAVMMVAGAINISFKKFLYLNLFGATFKSLLLLLVGYYFGGMLNQLGKDLNLFTSLGLLILTLLIFGIYLFVSKISGKYLKNLEED